MSPLQLTVKGDMQADIWVLTFRLHVLLFWKQSRLSFVHLFPKGILMALCVHVLLTTSPTDRKASSNVCMHACTCSWMCLLSSARSAHGKLQQILGCLSKNIRACMKIWIERREVWIQIFAHAQRILDKQPKVCCTKMFRHASSIEFGQTGVKKWWISAWIGQKVSCDWLLLCAMCIVLTTSWKFLPARIAL